MTAARNTPLVAAVPKMLFPILVIVPGMIAIALTSMPNKNYRIPPPIIAEDAYTKAVAAVKAGSPAQAAATVTAVGEALGKKINAEKVTALIAANAAKTMPDAELRQGLYNAVAEYDYDGVILSLVKKYCPPGLLGLALTALLASFMSGMAGNVTAFNTVWTYDIYKPYLRPQAGDAHLMWMGRMATVFGTLASIATAYVAMTFGNIMDLLQLVFSFINAPLFATFLLGMFWARATANGAFWGLISGTLAAAAHYMLTGVGREAAGALHVYPSDMAQNFWGAIWAWTTCFVMTIATSLVTAPRKPEDLKGLVYSLTSRLREDGIAWYRRPGVLAVAIGLAALALNIYFR
jgi:SSS family solute:Na+ symporter